MENKLTEKQIPEYQRAFDLLDKDKNGTITTSELGDAMRSTGLDPSEEDVKEMIKKADADNSGTLSFAEFQKLMVHEVKKTAMKDLRDVFSSYDKDNDGTVTVEEARAGLKQQGVKDEDIEESITLMFKGTDFNKDDKLIFEELLLNYLFAPEEN